MKRNSPLVLFCHIPILFSAQQSIKGVVTDTAGAPVPYCSMALYRGADSSLVKGNLADSLGRYSFEKVPAASYFIKFMAAGFRPARSPLFVLDSLAAKEMPPQVLLSDVQNLKEVSVTVDRPAIEFSRGMVIMNVENDLLSKGNTVLDLLRRLPGVNIDPQNNISINGVSGARFLIDDRLQQMPANQVIEMLSGMSADLVKKIELIKNPPARYDASGTGGLINIVTKKAGMRGYSGNVGFGASQGKRFRYGPSFSLSYKNRKLALFSNASLGIWDGLDVGRQDRYIKRGGNNEYLNSDFTNASFQRVFFGNAGAEYDIGKKTMLGFYINGSRHDDRYEANAQTNIVNSSAFNYDRLDIRNSEQYFIVSPNYNLSLVHKLDTNGGQVKIRSGYNLYSEHFGKQSLNRFYDLGDNEVVPMSRYDNLRVRDFRVFSEKVDLNKTILNGVSLESGLSANFADNLNTNRLQYSNTATGLFTGDTTMHNDFRYLERILGAYCTLSKDLKKVGLSVGLRVEQTDVTGRDLRSNFVYTRNYWNFFPSGSLELHLNKKNNLTLAYSRRIDRPHYGMLNPIRIVNEQLSYEVGNLALRPQLSHNVNLDHNYNQFITQSIGYDRISDFTFWYSYTPQGSKVMVDTISNLRTRDNAYYSLNIQKRIKWYRISAYGVVMYRAFSGQLIGEDVSSRTEQLYFNFSQEFFLPKDFRIQTWAGRGSGFYDGPQYYYPRSAVHISVQKQLLDQKLTITLGFYDVLYKDFLRYSNNFSEQGNYWENKNDSRRVRVMINYRFGKMRIEQRVRTDEDPRMQGGR